MASENTKMVAPETSGNTSRPKLEVGSQIGILYGIIDLGTQSVEWNGQSKLQRKIMLQFEFPDTTHVFDEKKGPEPLVLSRKFTWTMSENGHFRAFINGWRGKALTDEQAKAFDVGAMIGVAGLVNVTERDYNGKTYQNIDSVSKLPKAMQANLPKVHNPLTIYNVNAHGFGDKFSKLYDWLKNIISESVEFEQIVGLTGQAGLNKLFGADQSANQSAPQQPKSEAVQKLEQESSSVDSSDSFEDDDDLPF